MEMNISFIRMQLKHCQLKNVMTLFVGEVHYAILLYLYESFLLRSPMFSLNIKQLPQNFCEIIILPNYIKCKNHLIINPSRSLRRRGDSSSQMPPLFQHWVSYCLPHTYLSCESAIDAEEVSWGGWHFIAFTYLFPNK